MELRVLGPVEVCRAGERLRLDGPKQRTLLAALVLARGHPVSDDRLCALLWGDNPPATVGAQLCNYVSRLRKVLAGGAVVERRAGGYALRAGTALVDCEEFDRLARVGRHALRAGRDDEAAETLRSALALWRGRALGGVLERLADDEADRLHTVRLAVLEDRIAADLRLGRHAQLVGELVTLVADNPLHEGLRARLMHAMVACDRRADAIEVYHQGRRLLADELGIDPGPALRAVFQQVLDAHQAPVTGGWSGIQPAMLPPEVTAFHGRAEELRQLGEVLGADEGPRLVSLTGMAGAGKTALGLRAAHAARKAFPDGQLYVDLGGTSERPVDPGDVLGWFLRGLGNPESTIPRGTVERMHLYRSQLAGRRMLVMLDNVAGDEQVRPLLPGEANCRVIVTSRRPVAVEMARTVGLGPLGEHEALALFAEVVGVDRVAAEAVAARQIIRLCGRLALGLRVAGARLAARPHWSLGRFAARLRAENCCLDELRIGGLDVRRSIYHSYRDLTERGQVALRRLSLLEPTGFPGWAPAALLGLSRTIGEEITEQLVDARVVQVAPDRYQLHSLVRVFARELTDPSDRLAAAMANAPA